MILDRLDIEILRKIYSLKEGEELSIWNWVKTCYPELKKNREKTKKLTLIQRRIRKMSKLFHIGENGKTIYTLLNSTVELLQEHLESKDDLMIEIENKCVRVYKLLSICE